MNEASKSLSFQTDRLKIQGKVEIKCNTERLQLILNDWME